MSGRIRREQEFHDQRFALPSARARRVGRYYGITHTIRERYRQWLVRNSAGAKVLELGCGLVDDTLGLAKRGTRVVSVDISMVALDAARARAEADAAFSQMDAGTLGFADHSFDVVCGAGVLHHLQMTKAMNEISRVLRPMGRAVFIEPLGHNPLINIFRRLTPSMRSEDECPLRTADLRVLSRYFDNVNVEYHYLAALMAAPLTNLRGSESLLNTLESVDRLLFQIPFLRRQAWQVLLSLSEPIQH